MSASRTISFGRSLVMFVVAWLVGVYVYDIVTEEGSVVWGLLLAAATFGVNMYARYRAVRTVGETNWKFSFWLALPLILFFIVPAIVKVVTWYGNEDATFWNHFKPLLPFILKLGVPVLVLLWVYYIIGTFAPESRGGNHAAASGSPADTTG